MEERTGERRKENSERERMGNRKEDRLYPV